METTVPYLQEQEYPFDDELLQQQHEIRSAEESFQTLLSRLTASGVFLASSLIVYYLLPFYPPTMAVFLALIPAVIAYRWPAVALFLMLLFAAPAYSYQLGVTIWALSIMVTIAVSLSFALSRLPGASLGSAVGAAAGVLMLTPYFYLSLPLLAGITLLRLRGSLAGGGWGFFMFMAFYLPFLALADTSIAQGDTIPLFLRVDYVQESALSNLDMNSLKAAFQDQINHNFGGFSSLSAYFVQGWGGIALVLTMFTAIVIAPPIVNTTRQLRVGGTILHALTPLILLLTVELVFLVPLQLLAEPLGYRTGFATWQNIALLTGIMFALGTLAFLVETWIHRRNLKVELRSDLALLSLELYDLLDSTKKCLHQVTSVCRNIDLSNEKAIIAQCEEKVSLTLESTGVMGLPQLELSYNEFCDMQSELPKIQLQLENKLFDHLNESRRTYKVTVEQALALGIPTIEDVIETPQPSPAHNDYDYSIWEQQELNNAFQKLAVKLVSTGDMVANTIKDEIDPEFSLTTIDISHGFLSQGRFEEAARTITEDLQIIDGRIEGSIVELAQRVVAMTKDFKEVMTTRLMPVLESIGDSDSLGRCDVTVGKLEAITGSVHESRTLADIISIVEQSRKLADLATSTMKDLRQMIKDIEAGNDRRCPTKYSWGKNSHATSEIQQLLSSIEQASSDPTISSRFSLIEKAVQAVEQQAKTIKQYSQIKEFLINYPNIEYIVQEKLSTNLVVASSELPVKPGYALEYLKMYASMHHSAVTLDPRSGVLKHTAGNGTNQDEISP